MNNKILLAYLSLMTAPFFFAFHGLENEKKASATSAGTANEKYCVEKQAGGTHACTTNNVEPATNIMLQSTDGGQTWQDISDGLPDDQLPDDLFGGISEVYLRVNNVMYHSKNNLKTPVWEKDNIPYPENASIAFNRSGVMVYNEGKIYQQVPDKQTLLPVFTNFKNQTVENVFETSDGTVLIGCRDGLYRSSDQGRSWKQVAKEGWVIDIIESEGVLIGTSQKGIMRSTDNGEHWQWVISEGGVGIAVEAIKGGLAAISYNTTIKSRRVHISLDNGQTWTAINEGLKPSLSISSIKQIGDYLVVGHPDIPVS
jgi:photosystem II stability/assembly factor-like uncharacterized protein